MRHRERHVLQTVVDHVRTILTDGGWMSESGLFGGPVVTLVDHQPIENGETPAFNTVAVTFGNQTEDLDQELGGSLTTTSYALFVDIFPTDASVGRALAGDIKAGLTSVVIPVHDYAAGVDTDEQIEFEHVLVEVVPTGSTSLDKRTWRVVNAMATTYWAQ